LRRVAERYQLRVIDAFRRIESGQDLFGGTMLEAIEFARKHGAVLLAETVDRFLRHPHFHPVCNPDAQATEEQLAELAALADGVTLATALDPDATPTEVRAYRSKRGQWAKDNRGGRPKKKRPGYKKARREALRQTVIELDRDGLAQREIARRTGVPRSTVQNWLGARE
jgi:hypothetical protein